MNRASTNRSRSRHWTRILLASIAGCVLGSTGCLGPDTLGPSPDMKVIKDDGKPSAELKPEKTWYDPLGLIKPPEAPAAPAEILTLKAEGIVATRPPAPGTAEAAIAGAYDLFRRGEYEQAAPIYHYHAERETNSGPVRAEARFYEAECYRLMGDYPKAADLYVDLLNKFGQNPYREQALQYAFDIANFWLDDTRAEMREAKEKNDGKRSFAWPNFFNTDKKKPFMDEQGRAIEKLEQVRYNDINGPLADKALFLCGLVKLFNEDYRDADFYFSQIFEKHKDSPLAAKALEYGIRAKELSTGGADYDGRKLIEARKMVQAAFQSFPELAGDPVKRKYLSERLITITLQQAEKDFKTAEFYRRTGHAGAAYWYYCLIIQRYPTTDFAALSLKRREEVRADAEKDAAKKPTPPKQMVSEASHVVPAVATSPAPTQTLPGGALPGQ